MNQKDYNGYKLGALKRKFKTGRDNQEPGTFIRMASKGSKRPVQPVPQVSREKVAIMGLI